MIDDMCSCVPLVCSFNTVLQGSRKCQFVGPRMVFEELDQFSFQKHIKKSIHNNSCFVMFDFKIYTLSGAIKTNKSFVNT